MESLFRMGEFFSGPGGMALGAEFAAHELGYDVSHVWANDFDEHTAQTYEENIQPQRFIRGDVNEVDVASLEDIDGFAFGFPCNDFSTLGENRGLEGKFGPLYLKGIEVLETKQPKWFVAENVVGLLSANGGTAFNQIVSKMHWAGYKLVPHVYKFEKYGVPQTRHRVIIVGIRDDLDVTFQVPAPSTPNPLSVDTELADIPAGAPNHEPPRHAGKTVERLTHILPGQNAFNAELPQELKLNVKGATLSSIYRRLERGKPSYTITGSGGGGTHVYHWDEPRALTNRERARIQTFPNDFRFSGGPAQVRKQVGMAVPVEGARAVFSALFKSFLGQKYDTVAPSLNRIPNQDLPSAVSI